jgi:hypothetical protein
MNIPRPKTSTSTHDLAKEFRASKAKEFPSYKKLPRFSHPEQAVIHPLANSVKQPFRNSQPNLEPYVVQARIEKRQ